MKQSKDRFLISHAGALPRPPELLDVIGTIATTKAVDEDAFQSMMPGLVKDIVKRQADIGFDIVNDGEYSKRGGYNFYMQSRLGGLEEVPADNTLKRWSVTQRDEEEFPGFFDTNPRGKSAAVPLPGGQRIRVVACTGPLTYDGQEKVAFDIANLKSAAAEVPGVQPCLGAVAPGQIEHWLRNRYYKSQEEFLFAIADAVHDEYKAITDAGVQLYVDNPDPADGWQQFLDISVEDYRKYAQVRVEALNYALRDCPEEMLRMHICWGSGHGPHKNDLDLRHIIDVICMTKIQCFNIEAANPRHEHEWEVFETFKLPEGKMLAPGVVGHTSDLIEHPELVAQRLIRYANLVGKENVIACTDCGIGSRVSHPEIAWAKLASLVEGAHIASKKLWN